MHSAQGKPTYAWFILIALIAFVAVLTTAEEFKCFECSGDNCLDQSKFTETKCADGVTKCYTFTTENGVTRGCYKAETCTEGENCVTCTASGCNNNNICKKCDTGDNDCSLTDVSNAKFNQICKAASTKCFVNVKDKKIERRCATDGDNCSDTVSCKKCTGSNCNAGIFPAERRKCFQCKDKDCDAIGSNKDNAKLCLNYVANDKCYVTGTSAEAMIRGCLSDTDPKACEETDKACSVCTTDSCNSAAYKRTPALKCIKCKDTAECNAEQNTDKAEDCKEQLLYNQTESCYTLTEASNAQRGCLYDDPDVQCGDSNKECTRCQENGCNKAKADVKFTCIVCRSDLNKKCWNDPTKIDGKTCRTTESSPEEGCFYGIWNGIAIRGCYVDADERMKVICSDKKNTQCQVCKGKNCNTPKLSGAGSLTISFSLLSILLATLLRT